MPQLNPTPWFITHVILWAILLMLLKPHFLLVHIVTPPSNTPNTPQTITWTWPWP